MFRSTVLFLLISTSVMAQQLPYAEIPAAPAAYNACTVAARMIDGLGFRFYWATEGLTDADYVYQTGNDARTIGETIEHINGLANVITYASLKKGNDSKPSPKITTAETRNQILVSLKAAADILRNAQPEEMEEFNVIFKRGNNETILPFWNVINGPVEDAIWHAGQIVTLRRMAGNPVNPKVNFMSGTAGK